MSRTLTNRLDFIEPRLQAASGHLEKSVYGVVDKVIDGIPNIVRAWKGTIGNMVETDEEPTILFAEKLEPAILNHKKYKCFFGGRAGTKSIFGMDMMIGEVNSTGCGVFCLREKMKSLSQSIYKGINGRVQQLDFAGFIPVESKWKIDHRNGGIISFGGLMNVRDMKSLFEYKYFLLEESDQTSQEAIDILGPTLRGVPGAELWYMWNPGSANDPMSTEFITPYQDQLDSEGFYEDEYHLIINIGFQDNPWFMGDESLRTEYYKDKAKNESGLMSNSRFRHIWHGAFNDDIENSLIDPDWFDACVDAHLKLNIKPKGAKVFTHDPADTGEDKKAWMLRHGIVFIEAGELMDSTANDAFDSACDIAIDRKVEIFGWDCDGMGALLRRQAADNFDGIKINTFMYKGSESVYLPEAICEHAEFFDMKGSKKNKDVFRNKRAQNYVALAERCRRTYDAVVNGTYYDPNELVSFSSDIKCLQKLRSELCRLPLKPNASNTIELYTKQEMKKGILMSDGSRRKIPSPNLGDCAKMSFDNAAIIRHKVVNVRPKPLKTMGKRR